MPLTFTTYLDRSGKKGRLSTSAKEEINSGGVLPYDRMEFVSVL